MEQIRLLSQPEWKLKLGMVNATINFAIATGMLEEETQSEEEDLHIEESLKAATKVKVTISSRHSE